ncbi:hypothetical protein OEZ86_005405 [Tetradesmus obliquus]|nr:hypothetical protein OEZ86_005405 [Tetradesmus obliquus]
MFPPFRPPNAPNVPRATRLRRYTALLAELRAATSIAEDDDAAVQKELEDMKFWIANEFVWTAGGIGGLTYDDSPRDVQQLVVDCVETTSHVLRLWANQPCVLQGSSAAAKELTSVLLLYVGMTWQGPSISEARQQVASPGFLIAYTSTCDALAAALDKASAADVPQHLGEFTAMLLWTWGGLLKMYEESSSGFLDPVLQPMLLPSARLAGAALRCWAGPAAAGLERTVPLSKAIHAATDVYLG